MVSINLFVLDELSRSESHGHQLRLKAQTEHVDVWTDIRVSGLYAALKRLAAEGLIASVRTESSGNFPERTVYGITDAGRTALVDLQRTELRKVTSRMDPFDLALQRSADLPAEEVRGALLDRRADIALHAADLRQQVADVSTQLNDMEKVIVEHVIGRLDYEVQWHDRVIADFDALFSNLRSTRGVNDDSSRSDHIQ